MSSISTISTIASASISINNDSGCCIVVDSFAPVCRCSSRRRSCLGAGDPGSVPLLEAMLQRQSGVTVGHMCLSLSVAEAGTRRERRTGHNRVEAGGSNVGVVLDAVTTHCCVTNPCSDDGLTPPLGGVNEDAGILALERNGDPLTRHLGPVWSAQ